MKSNYILCNNHYGNTSAFSSMASNFHTKDWKVENCNKIRKVLSKTFSGIGQRNSWCGVVVTAAKLKNINFVTLFRSSVANYII